MSTTTARIRPQELALPADGGLWVKQHQHQHQHQHRFISDPAQPDNQEDLHDQHCQPRPPQLPVNSTTNDLFVFANPNSNSSSSDLASPLTPTFSHHGGSHLRYASSTSSLDLQQSFSSSCSDSPASPAQQPPQNAAIQNAGNASPATASSTKRPLPDVQEEPVERDDNDDDEPTMTRLTDDQLDSLYDCLCMASSPPPNSIVLNG